MRPGLPAIALAGLLAGCAASDKGYMDEAWTAKGAKPVKVTAEYNGKTAPWYVYDLPAEGRIMVSPTYGDAMGMGMAGAAIRDPESMIPPETFYDGIARQHFADTGRPHCKTTRGMKASRAQYEFHYECPAPVAQTRRR